MQNRYLLLTAIAGLLAAPRAHAQQPWQPFRPGLTYQLSEHSTPGDTTHTLRVGAGAPVAGSATDSVFRFTQRVGRFSGTRGTANCWAWRWQRADNLFGATMRSQPRAVFVLAAANGRTLTLRPRAPLGQSWATGLAGLTASVTSRAVSSRVLGGATDSVVTITFSDGQQLYLSKSHGFWEGPSLDSYLNGRNVRRQLTLTALPERRLGTAVVGARAIHDYQPGDVFQRITRVWRGALCTQTWQQDSVLTRQVSRTGDTIDYAIRTRKRTAPVSSLCSSLSGPIVYPATTNTLRVIGPWATTAQPLAQLTSAYDGTVVAGDLVSAVSSNPGRWAGRPEYTTGYQGICYLSSKPDSAAIANPNVSDIEHGARYAVGLGQVYDSSRTFTALEITRLTAFRKGTQTWGTFFGPTTLLAAHAVRPAATTAVFPNPFSDALTAAFVLARAQPVGFALYDALGRQVRAVAAVPLGAGAQQVALPTAGLPAGVYTLHLLFAGEDRREVLQVAKAE
jgi:hypothetical protein